MICPKHKECREFCIRGRIPHEKDKTCNVEHEFCPKCVPVEDDMHFDQIRQLIKKKLNRKDNK